jgi:hypothetical protein
VLQSVLFCPDSQDSFVQCVLHAEGQADDTRLLPKLVLAAPLRHLPGGNGVVVVHRVVQVVRERVGVRPVDGRVECDLSTRREGYILRNNLGGCTQRDKEARQNKSKKKSVSSTAWKTYPWFSSFASHPLTSASESMPAMGCEATSATEDEEDRPSLGASRPLDSARCRMIATASGFAGGRRQK